MIILPKCRTKYGEKIGVEIFVQFPDLSEQEQTYLQGDIASGVASLPADGTKYANNSYLVVGNPTSQNSEIVLMTSATATAITCGTTVYPHNRGDLITIIPFNQITLSTSPDNVVWTPQTPVSISADSPETHILRTSDTSAYYYKCVFYNSTSTLSSPSSAVVPATQYQPGTPAWIKRKALRDMGESLTNLITDELMTDWLDEARRNLDQDPRVIRWTFRKKFGVTLGQVVPGAWSISAPTNLRTPNTNANIMQLRIGQNGWSIDYQDNMEFRQNYENIAHTTIKTTAAHGATSITLTSSNDFNSSGSIWVAANDDSGTISVIQYTANNIQTGVLTGVTGIPAAGLNAGNDAWYDINFGMPRNYTIDNSSGTPTIFFDMPHANQWAGQNVYLDYYSTMTPSSDESQKLDEPEFDLFCSYLKWKIKYLKANGNLQASGTEQVSGTIIQSQDQDYQEWITLGSALVQKELSGQRIRFYPGYSGN